MRVKRIVRAHEIRIEADSPVGQRPCPDSKNSRVFVDQDFAGIRACVRRHKSERSVSVGGATSVEHSRHQGAVSAIRIAGKELFDGRTEGIVVDGPMTVAESKARAQLGRKLVLDFREIGFLILFQKITVDAPSTDPDRNSSECTGVPATRIGRRGTIQRHRGKRSEYSRGSQQIGAEKRTLRWIELHGVVEIREVERIEETPAIADPPGRAEISGAQ